MKHIFLAILLLFTPTAASAESVEVTVKGMVCSFCAQGIKKTFGKSGPVEEVKVDLDQKLVTLKIREGQALTDEQIKTLLNDAGYDVAEIKRKP